MVIVGYNIKIKKLGLRKSRSWL